MATAWRSHTRRVGKRPSRLDFAVCAPRADARMGCTPRNRLQVEHCRARMRSNVRPVMRSWVRQVWRHGCAAVRRRRKPPACGGRADRPGGISNLRRKATTTDTNYQGCETTQPGTLEELR